MDCEIVFLCFQVSCISIASNLFVYPLKGTIHIFKNPKRSISFSIGGSKGGGGGAKMTRAPLSVQISSISCSFWEKLAKILGWLLHLCSWHTPCGKSWIRQCLVFTHPLLSLLTHRGCPWIGYVVNHSPMRDFYGSA